MDACDVLREIVREFTGARRTSDRLQCGHRRRIRPYLFALTMVHASIFFLAGKQSVVDGSMISVPAWPSHRIHPVWAFSRQTVS